MGNFFKNLKEKLHVDKIDQTHAAVGIMTAALVLVAAAVLVMAFSGIDIRDAKASEKNTGKQQETEQAEAEKEAVEEAPEDTADKGMDADGVNAEENGAAEEDAQEDADSQSTVPQLTIAQNEPQPGLIHAISAGELEVIRQTYDGTVRGYGIGLEGGSRDQYNRQLQAVNINSQLNALNANVLVFSSDPNTPAAALAFQAGYEAGYTSQVLDILKEYDVRATFFVTMEYVTNNPDLVKRMLDEGHEIGSHSASCPDEGIANYSLDDQMNDALQLQTFMEEHYNYTMTKYNFNSGVYSTQQAILMTRMGYQFVFCSLNYSDYDPQAEFNSEEVLASLEDMMHNGCIYCFHMTNKVTVEILPGLLQCMRDEGYSIISLR